MKTPNIDTTLRVTLPSGEKADVPLVVRRNGFGGADIEVGGATVSFDDKGRILDPADEHLCNWCGLTILLGDAMASSPHGMYRHTVSGGYASTPGNGDGALDDGDTYTFSLCELCIDHMFSQFQIPPTMGSYMGGVRPFFEPAADRVKHDEWRTTKDKFFAEKARRDAARAKPLPPRPNPIQTLCKSLWRGYNCNLLPATKTDPWILSATVHDSEEPYAERTAVVTWEEETGRFHVSAKDGEVEWVCADVDAARASLLAILGANS